MLNQIKENDDIANKVSNENIFSDENIESINKKQQAVENEKQEATENQQAKLLMKKLFLRRIILRPNKNSMSCSKLKQN